MGLWYLLDLVMGGLWVAVYALVIVGSLKYKCPRISPLFPVLVLPWELTAVLYDFAQKTPVSWTQINRIGFCTGNMIIGMIILRWFMQNNDRRWIYNLLIFIFFTAIMHQYVFRTENGELYFSFIVTLLGCFFWLLYILKKDFEPLPIDCVIAAIKMTADAIGCAWYFNQMGSANFLCIMLLLIHMIHFVVVVSRIYQKKHFTESNCNEK